MSRLVAIIISIGICGMCQGLIIPLLALLLERRGVSALFNGVSTTALFFGVIIASPFIEHLVRRHGAKRIILASTGVSVLMTLSFALWDNIYAWLFFRLVLGIALAGLFVATEIWLNRILTDRNRGRMFAFYGLSIAIGMLIGPQGMQLLELSEKLPFLFSALLFLIPFAITWRVSDAGSELDPVAKGEEGGLKRWLRIFLIAPFAMCASLVYGYLDSALNGDFPIYGARIGLSDASISWSLTIFVLGSIMFQFPLGYLSDRWGRRPALILATVIGMLGFVVLPLVSHSFWWMMAALFISGGALGSFYSLGLASLGDVISRQDIATANVLYTMVYGIGSLIGPSVTGWLIYGLGKNLFAWSIAGMLFCYATFGILSLRSVKKTSLQFTQKGREV
ncbi:MAG: MFS transporter [Tumebacillaceae bacterium]